jgi:hypothetical protein
MWFVKLIPLISILYYELFKKYYLFECPDMLFLWIKYLIAIALIPLIGVLTILFYIDFGFYRGLTCAIEGYHFNVYHGFISICRTIAEVDELSNSYIFDTECTCFTCGKDNKRKFKRNDQNQIKSLLYDERNTLQYISLSFMILLFLPMVN